MLIIQQYKDNTIKIICYTKNFKILLMSLSLFHVPMHLEKNQSSKGREKSFCDSLAKISTVACAFGYQCINRYLSF